MVSGIVAPVMPVLRAPLRGLPGFAALAPHNDGASLAPHHMREDDDALLRGPQQIRVHETPAVDTLLLEEVQGFLRHLDPQEFLRLSGVIPLSFLESHRPGARLSVVPFHPIGEVGESASRCLAGHVLDGAGERLVASACEALQPRWSAGVDGRDHRRLLVYASPVPVRKETVDGIAGFSRWTNLPHPHHPQYGSQVRCVHQTSSSSDP